MQTEGQEMFANPKYLVKIPVLSSTDLVVYPNISAEVFHILYIHNTLMGVLCSMQVSSIFMVLIDLLVFGPAPTLRFHI